MKPFVVGELPRCSKCSGCCRAIGITSATPRYTKAVIRKEVQDGKFIAKHWHRISREMAIAINPNMRNRPKFTVFYSCDCVGEDNRCMEHKNRPHVCVGYPGYGAKVNWTDESAAPGCTNFAEPVE